MTKFATGSQRLAMEKRGEERMSVTRPVVLARGSGVTRNISTSGVFFETNADYVVGSKIIFAIELDGSQGEKLELRSRGEIVRIEHRAGKVGVAVKIDASKLELGHPSTV
jgi:PilZ domain